MRTSEELIFRTKQELNNLRLLLTQPSTSVRHVSITGLPDPGPIIERLRNTQFAAEVERLAEMVLQHRFPVAGGLIETGDVIEWRRDYRNGVSSGPAYFRFIPYLDLAKVGDHKVIWDLNRQQHLVVLAQAFRLTSRQTYLQEIERQILSWVDHNRFMRGINWTSALEVAFRAQSFIWVYHLIGDLLPAAAQATLINSLYRHGRYLEHNLSVYFAPNTHLIGEAVALHALGLLLPSLPDADRWRTSGAEMVARQMTTQIRDDGSHFEQSAYYQVYALDMLMFHQALTVTTDEFRSKLWRMADFLDALMGTSRTLPLIGDDDGGRFFNPYGKPQEFARGTIATCARFFDEPKWSYDQRDLYEQAVWWLGANAIETASAAQPSAAPPESRLFADSGLAVLTSNTRTVIVDGGPLGAAGGGHSHSDSLSVIVTDDTDQILVDAGTYTYVGDAEQRNWFRGSAAHNTVRVDSQNQAVAIGPFRWIDKPDVEILKWERTKDRDVIDAVCRYRHLAPLVHRRTVALLRDVAGVDLLLVKDRVEGLAGNHLIEQFWHPGEAFQRVAAGHVRIGKRGHLLVPDGGEFHTEEQWRSERFGERSPATALVVRRESTLPAALLAVMTFGAVPPIRFSLVKADGVEAALEMASGDVISLSFDSVDDAAAAVQIHPRA
jgi:hypothetical protein